MTIALFTYKPKSVGTRTQIKQKGVPENSYLFEEEKEGKAGVYKEARLH